MKLLSTHRIGYQEEKNCSLSWDTFEVLSKTIVKDILDNQFHKQKICLLGTARGALPLLTYVSHQTGIRDISIIQLQMTQSDMPFDYGNVSILLKAIREDYDKFIILEDIVYKGQTIQCIQTELENDNKKICAIYSLIIDAGYNNENINTHIKSSALLKNNIWVKFPWEKEICTG